MKISNPSWWNSMLPWRALNPHLPLTTRRKSKVTGIVVHRQGQYGWAKGNWVTGDPEGDSVHYGLDIIGWVNDSGPQVLDNQSICCSPLTGVVAWVGPDEHGSPSMILRHSSRIAERRRFSFFGDLDEVYVKAGQDVSAGAPLGRPGRLHGECRFFHYSIGYEVRRKGKWQDIFIDPGPSLPGTIVVRPKLPWKTD